MTCLIGDFQSIRRQFVSLLFVLGAPTRKFNSHLAFNQSINQSIDRSIDRSINQHLSVIFQTKQNKKHSTVQIIISIICILCFFKAVFVETNTIRPVRVPQLNSKQAENFRNPHLIRIYERMSPLRKYSQVFFLIVPKTTVLFLFKKTSFYYSLLRKVRGVILLTKV